MSGELLLEEIREQGDALRRLLGAAADVETIATTIARRRPYLLRMVAHGSSDNVATYGVYAFGLLAGQTAVRDSISLLTYYGAALDFRGSVVLAISQSGETPDVVEYARRARDRGAFTVAITNDAGSSLAEAADVAAFICAGPEHAVAATKTYTNQLATLALLAAELAGRSAEIRAALEQVARLADETVESTLSRIHPVAVPFASVDRMFVIGRGPEYATAREIALKLTETCRIAAEALTATDLAHGPVAAVDPLFPVWAIASDDPGLPTVLAAAEEARTAGATIIAAGTVSDQIEGAVVGLPSPRAPLPILNPLLSVLSGQVFAWALALAKGLDPDRPEHLHKVTLAP